MEVDPPLHPPEKHDWVQFRRSWIAERPARSPSAKNVDDALKLSARAGQVVLDGASFGTGAALDDAHPLQSTEAIDKERARNAGKSSV